MLTGRHQFITEQFTIISVALAGYEKVDSLPGTQHRVPTIISHPTNATGIIVSLKTPPKHAKRKTTKIKLKKLQKVTRRLAIFVDHAVIAHIP